VLRGTFCLFHEGINQYGYHHLGSKMRETIHYLPHPQKNAFLLFGKHSLFFLSALFPYFLYHSVNTLLKRLSKFDVNSVPSFNCISIFAFFFLSYISIINPFGLLANSYREGIWIRQYIKKASLIRGKPESSSIIRTRNQRLKRSPY